MKKLEVFDPAMCCSTGVCGVDVDPVLAQFAADLKWVAEQGCFRAAIQSRPGAPGFRRQPCGDQGDGSRHGPPANSGCGWAYRFDGHLSIASATRTKIGYVRN